MTIFNAFLKILKKNKFIIIMYTVILVLFGGLNMQTSEKEMNFQAVKPNIMIVNNDKEEGITKGLIEYLKENCKIIELENDEEKINDALFYREINYVVYIPENYSKDFNNLELTTKSTKDYNASYAEMLVKKYVETANIYKDENQIKEVIKKQSTVEITTKLDTNSLSKAAFYYNFESYSILACLIYVICLVLSVFNNEKIRKKNIISSTNYKKLNRTLLLSNCIYSLTIWLFYLIMSFILLGNIMFTQHGLILIINSFIFMICATTLAFLVGTILTKKEAVNGIMNIIALGSSFLCGAFVPVEYLPDSVLKIAHVIPTYWYIQNNEVTKTLEEINIDTLKPIITNWIVILIFSVIFIIITNIISKRKQKLD